MKLWLRADLGTTIVTGVSSWIDQSGQANNATQAVTTAQPTLTASDAAFNNQATISFNGSTFSMNLPFSPLATTCTVFFVGNTAQAAATQGNIITDSADPELVVEGGATVTYTIFDGAAFAAPAVTPATPVSVAAIFNGAASSIYQNSSLSPAATGNAGTVAGGGVGSIGSAGGAANFFNGKIAEIAVFDSILSPSQISSLMQYAAQRYGTTWK